VKKGVILNEGKINTSVPSPRAHARLNYFAPAPGKNCGKISKEGLLLAHNPIELNDRDREGVSLPSRSRAFPTPDLAFKLHSTTTCLSYYLILLSLFPFLIKREILESFLVRVHNSPLINLQRMNDQNV
jgi:hypothetical protein